MTEALANKIHKALKKAYPEAKTIAQNQWGYWDVTCDDGFDEEIYTYTYENDKLRCIGLLRMEI